jgi:hypothetical protein
MILNRGQSLEQEMSLPGQAGNATKESVIKACPRQERLKVDRLVLLGSSGNYDGTIESAVVVGNLLE